MQLGAINPVTKCDQIKESDINFVHLERKLDNIQKQQMWLAIAVAALALITLLKK